MIGKGEIDVQELKTVGDYIRELRKYPEEWLVKVSTQAGGGIAVEHREIKGQPVVAIFGRNGGQFGESPLTEQEYAAKSSEFLVMLKCVEYYAYTSMYGDHRVYSRGSDSCYGRHFDSRIVERMVAEGLIPANEVDIERVRSCEA